MWLPVLSYTEGYGVTYGVRIAAVDDCSEPRSSLSVPLTWGGERARRPAAEAVVRARTGDPRGRRGFDIRQSEHPAFDLDERRVGGDARVERAVTSWLRLGAAGRLDDVEFDGDTSRLSARYGGEVIRRHPPRPGLSAQRRVDRRRPRRLDCRIVDVAPPASGRRQWRRRAVPRLGAERRASSRCRPTIPCRRSSRRGSAARLRCAATRAGYRVDDNAAGASASFAYPLGSPLNSPASACAPSWTGRPSTRRRPRGRTPPTIAVSAAGCSLTATALTIGLDVARSDDGNVRVHFRLGTRF